MATNNWVVANTNFWSNPELQALSVSSNLFSNRSDYWSVKDGLWLETLESLGIHLSFDDLTIDITYLDYPKVHTFSWYDFKYFLGPNLRDLVSGIQYYWFEQEHAMFETDIAYSDDQLEGLSS